MPSKKKIQEDKRKKMTSLKLYLQNKAAERADKLQLRQAKRLAKIEAEKAKKTKKTEEHVHGEAHVHTEECNHEH